MSDKTNELLEQILAEMKRSTALLSHFAHIDGFLATEEMFARKTTEPDGCTCGRHAVNCPRYGVKVDGAKED